MKRYIKNLWTAITGKNPYKQELGEIKKSYQKASDDLKALHVLYCTGIDRLDESKRRLKDADKELVKCRNLIEVLRERVKEKDELIEQTNKDCNARIASCEKRFSDYAQKVGELQDGRRRPARNSKNRKTNKKHEQGQH